MNVYPLVFEPILKRRIWGGRTLATLFGKKLLEGIPIGESWEVVDLEDDQSVVANGPEKGKTLRQLTATWGKDLMGRTPLLEDRFPLLIKFLDARDMLSVQVHPDEATARRLGGRVRMKNEAWYVIDAMEGAYIYRGIRPGVDAYALRIAIANDSIESALQRIDVRKGHCFYLPSGTVHALGGGIVVAEIQTPSDITYRVYDWDRIDPTTGRRRELHVEEALACIAFDSAPEANEQKHHIASVWTSVTTLVKCESFLVQRTRMVEGVDQEIPYDEMMIWILLEGRLSILHQGQPSPVTIEHGQTVVLPAGLKTARVQTHQPSMWLEVSVPLPSTLAGFDRPDRVDLLKTEEPGRYVPLRIEDKTMSRGL